MKVASFTIDHDRLLRGIYVSRKDKVGNETVTTFDVRFKRPNILWLYTSERTKSGLTA